MQDLLQGSGDLCAPPDRFDPAVGGALTLFYQLAQLFLVGLCDEIERVLKPEFRDDINVAGILLIK